MTKLLLDEIDRRIDEKIRQHEIRVAFSSGALGAALFLGTFHAIAMLHHAIQQSVSR